MSALVLTRLSKSYGGVETIRNIDLEVAAGEFVVLVGSSGCGKSTVLRLIAGLEDVSAGTIRIGDRDVTHVPAAARGVAMVFQSYALYPHMTVRENLSFGLRNMKVPRARIAAQVAHAAEILELGELLDRLPNQLSGGQRQRVAIGRAIVRDPSIFLFDEPLSNLDADLRVRMRHELARLHKRLGSTMIYVTHDQVEAMTLADRLVVLDAGRISQVGTPLEVYERPANVFTAGFIGSPRINLLEARVIGRQGGEARLEIARGIRLAKADGGVLRAGERATIGLRPEHLSAEPHPQDVALTLAVEAVEALGHSTFLYAHLDGAGEFRVKLDGHHALTPPNSLTLYADPARMLLFDSAGTAITSETR
ncbi:sn-glycerol-3-phosphate ABC transporter ATP-binding protein UgpC [Sphingomonas psychrotolerans]|uniref:Sn-glycerol-3-phosphate ABC transporter ATP-binding protein UgpC n=1 Tax=Sphingomonas psychrotolerans TaxID=1327635 RepID=A0ABU3N8V4_9SPHN|nr:sn-glycerol-3-phosphate ABC transporter ATP-binding protein UgpC [Sphingomonas psychrotolerans]MDT8760908.1 sn-glycerol-3-phosphate ABC transporter ATP-binding protein UgpC [Sphingomonas psychrotolerans]